MYPSMYGYVSHKVETGWVSLSLSWLSSRLGLELSLCTPLLRVHTYIHTTYSYMYSYILYMYRNRRRHKERSDKVKVNQSARNYLQV